MLNQHQKGFTLVELMVAMAIGTLVILGAGQLFITTLKTFQKVEEISRKQEVVVFAANTLVNGYRKGNGNYELQSTKDSSGNELDECSIFDLDIEPNSQPIVGGLADDFDCDNNRFVQDAGLNGYRKFTLDFERDGDTLETLSFHVMNRSQAVNPVQ
ncbi:prepilin-type N-terminal cleavage/methylation domain-containing protein [Halomonas vilamensis]|uniref:Prepilin-type N-terminal cleavage/methylation domain-containing protein n=1 Tax=Vreelandella vilamensis TaxID=531309 RepID=A0ABU1H6K3_9GAMM|nr:prepilin-type N-terminal cleavage/methylation domain-containing protein [Halomonas vilamensis]MDR5899387.1 prepilin-type N-terminal cleavage/methylation domain-containing protein [Halomonas vilamensis]